MNLKKEIKALKDQMSESEKVAYKLLDDVPWVVKQVGKIWIDEIQRILEEENKKVWETINKLEKKYKEKDDETV